MGQKYSVAYLKQEINVVKICLIYEEAHLQQCK